MLDLGGTFSDFMSSFFGFLNEFLQSVFSFLSNFFSGLHINIS